ncbi:tRNA1(Val) (adenine(37)-N6)-methyltransferase [Shewanella pealeana]|uniref:tRNA1(Val) (adenine(37)-N6)-methyltransferase n=1 Tax=Shewanella pealeana (strain ATCC 700345 / ANG-SQ1) TaxID=398579 RepID=TRMN6_SHEPA|nr:methyltransferase [Shewanella pealeana]A8H0P3.1 RecName: Full=tRNA1(Val) (adenine(37)-N6)-methyltransferase; AltName: Full=tRNA m6A37 methyltransferase [Shewanella pealeana ATCC 700345]ABV86130.1 methyltransferase small [Shewanella pealeana ATCC 700345]
MPFTFKLFHVDDSRCGMPVSTDGVLLGAWAPLVQAKTILDIGAGSGLLSLMAAQRSLAKITAIEVDTDAALDCQQNFNASPWFDRLEVICCDIQAYAQAHTQVHSQAHNHAEQSKQFEHIICNPPYFANGPQSSNVSRATARHTDSLSFDSLLAAIKQLLSPEGCASLILPTESVSLFETKLSTYQLELSQKLLAASVEGKEANRQILVLRHTSALAHDPKTETEPAVVAKLEDAAQQQLYIREKNGQYSQAFSLLSRDFYLKL